MMVDEMGYVANRLLVGVFASLFCCFFCGALRLHLFIEHKHKLKLCTRENPKRPARKEAKNLLKKMMNINGKLLRTEKSFARFTQSSMGDRRCVGYDHPHRPFPAPPSARHMDDARCIIIRSVPLWRSRYQT